MKLTQIVWCNMNFWKALPLLALSSCASTISSNDYKGFSDFLVKNPQETQKILNSLSAYQLSQSLILEQKVIQDNKSEIFDRNFGRILGKEDQSKDYIVMFSDPNCKFCRQMIGNIIKKSESRENRYNVIIRELPVLGKGSVTLSGILLSASNDKYSLFYKSLSDDLRHTPVEVAAQLGLESSSITTSSQAKDEITKNSALAQRLQINSTPTFIIGDKIHRGITNQLLKEIFL